MTEFTGGETQYTFLFSRLRKPSSGPLADVPLRMRAASNPGGPGHSWVKARFIPDEFLKSDDEDRFSKVYNTNGRVFVPARLEDNPSLNREEYERGLPQLEPVTRAQMRKGDWTAHASGRFQPGWFRRYRIQGDTYLLDNGECILRQRVLRAALLDPANRKTKASKYTAIGVFAFSDGDRLFVLDVVRERLSIQEIIPRFDSLCGRWGPLDWAGIEANGFQIALVQEATDRKYRHIPTVRELDPEGKSKLTRATAAIIRAQQGQVYVPERGPGTEWVDDYIAELCQFTGDEKQDVYTDQVDITA